VQGFGNGYYDVTLNVDGTLVSYGSSESDYAPRLYTDYALDFMASADGPFFLWYSTPPPHTPSILPPGSTCQFSTKFEKADFPSRPPMKP
jgi:hypothetical protein